MEEIFAYDARPGLRLLTAVSSRCIESSSQRLSRDDEGWVLCGAGMTLTYAGTLPTCLLLLHAPQLVCLLSLHTRTVGSLFVEMLCSKVEDVHWQMGVISFEFGLESSVRHVPCMISLGLPAAFWVQQHIVENLRLCTDSLSSQHYKTWSIPTSAGLCRQ